MSAARRWIINFALTAGLSLLASCGAKEEHKEDHQPATPDTAAAKAGEKPAESARPSARQADAIRLTAEEVTRAGIQLGVVTEEDLQDEIPVTATVQANEDALAHVAPRVPGRVVEVDATVGQRVTRGRRLALLDSLEVGKAHSTYLQALSESRLAREAYERAERLHAEQVIPAKDYQRARAENEKSRAALGAAADELRMLGVEPRGNPGSAAVSTFPIVSPQDGTIIERHAVRGEIAKPDQLLFTITDLSTLWVEADIMEKDLARVPRGAVAVVRVAAYPGREFSGRVTYIGATLAKETRTVKARIEVANTDDRLKPGMFASAGIRIGGSRKVLAVPERAVTLVQGQATVFVSRGDEYVALPVAAGDTLNGRTILQSGLNAGEKVVVNGVYALKARLLKGAIGEGHAH